MQIALDGKRAVENMTGLGNYSRFVTEALARYAPTDTIRLYAPRRRENVRLQPILALPNVELRVPAHPRGAAGRAFWRSLREGQLAAREGADIFHGLSNELPLNISACGLPSVVTVHDVIYRRLPDSYSPIDRRIYDFKYGHSCRAATRIVAISECTRRDIREFYGVPEERIDVIYQGCAPMFRQAIDIEHISRLRKQYALPARYIVQIGTVEPRKNLILTIRALAALPEDVNLVVIGRDRLGYRAKAEREAQRLGVAGRILWIPGAPLADLPALYAGAEVAAYPSRYEGFGLPVIEAIESGTPVVGATGSCLEEAGGEGGIYVNPDSPRDMAEALNVLLSNPELRRTKVEQGRRHTAQFDSSRMAASLHATYARAIADFQANK